MIRERILYNLLELIRRRKEDKINIAVFAYFLGRMEPKAQKGDTKEKIEEKEISIERFPRKCMNGFEEKDAKELEMAIYLYVYTKREKEENNGVNK